MLLGFPVSREVVGPENFSGTDLHGTGARIRAAVEGLRDALGGQRMAGTMQKGLSSEKAPTAQYITVVFITAVFITAFM